MRKLKIGDRVRRICNDNGNFKLGQTGIVTSISNYNGATDWIRINNNDTEHDPYYLELVVPKYTFFH